MQYFYIAFCDNFLKLFGYIINDDSTDEIGNKLNSSVGKVAMNFFVHEAMPPLPYNGAKSIIFTIIF